MSTNKVIGYVLIVLGLISFALTYDLVLTALKISLPAQLTSTILTIAAAILVIFGALLLSNRDSGRQAAEVPIYHGKTVVGYRRIRK